MTICIIDTSEFCNLLDVPGLNQNRTEAVETLKAHVASDHTLLLPLAAVFETGNHIAHVNDGRLRHRAGERFVSQVRAAVSGAAPWRATPIPDAQVMARWLDAFPDCVMRGMSLADLSIIKEFDRHRKLNKTRRVMIWSLDKHLLAYDSHPTRAQ